MMFHLNYLFTLVFCASLFPMTMAQDAPCIRSLAELAVLQEARGRRVGTHVTYILCPNTVYLPTDDAYLKLNGNASYLCGANGSSANNCIVRGGYTQVAINVSPYNRSRKDNITVSGFTFEECPYFNLVIAVNGRSTFRDCIFKNNNNYGALSLLYGSDPTSRRVRQLIGEPDDSINDEEDAAHLRPNEVRTLAEEQSLLNLGQPRNAIVFDKCEFRNNTLTTNEELKFIAANGVVSVISQQTDLTMTNCIFKDNRYELRRDGPGYGYLVFVEAGSTLNIQNSCFIDNYVESGAPVWVRCASGLIDSSDNYIDDIEYATDCQYMFNQEQYKCYAHESPSCSLPSCAASYSVFNARTDKFFASIANGATIRNPPCSINIEAILPCASNGVTAMVQLLQNGTVVQELAETSRFFLFGNNKNNILSGTIVPGTYTIQTKIDDVLQPAPFTFTLAGTCVR